MGRLPFCLILLVLTGCGAPHQDPKDVVARIGSYVIDREEFEAAYKESSYGIQNTPSSRRDFLNNMINEKLILLDAQSRGLDRDKAFLKMVEHFWQQSLITADLQGRSREGTNLARWFDLLKENTKIEINQELLK